jgi:GT2 family glycosyltransferase
MSASAAPSIPQPLTPQPSPAPGDAAPGTMGALDCSVVILNYNNHEQLRRGLLMLRHVAPTTTRVEVIVVDNGSVDGSQAMIRTEFPEVRLIENRENLGIARGKNTGLRAARGEFVLLLDDDCVVEPEQLAALLETARAHPDAAVVVPMKIDAHGRPMYTYHVPSPRTLGVAFFFVTELSLIEIGRAVKRALRWGEVVPHGSKTLIEIPYVGGGVMLVRRRAIQDVGPLDGNIFFFGEDFDWCYRFRRRGWKILYVPGVRVISGYAVNAVRSKRWSLVALQSRRYLFEKHVGRRFLPVYVALAFAGLAPKLAYYTLQDLRGRGPREPSTWEWLRRAFACILRDGPRPPAEGSHDC